MTIFIRKRGNSAAKDRSLVCLVGLMSLVIPTLSTSIVSRSSYTAKSSSPSSCPTKNLTEVTKSRRMVTAMYTITGTRNNR